MVGFSAIVNPASNHANTGAVTQNIVGCLWVHSADYRNASAVEFGKGVTGRTQYPQFRAFIIRIPLGHCKAAGANGAAYHHLALGHCIAAAVGGISKYGYFSPNVKIANVIRC